MSNTGSIDLERNKNGQYWFNIKASNHKIVATSEMYESRQGALNGIKSVRRFANSPIVDNSKGVTIVPKKEPAKPELVVEGPLWSHLPPTEPTPTYIAPPDNGEINIMISPPASKMSQIVNRFKKLIRGD